MSRATGRRVVRRAAEATPTGRSTGGILVGVVAVALTLGALALAGASGPVPPTPTGAGGVALNERTFVCTGGLPHTEAISGSVQGAGLARQPVGKDPVRKEVAHRAAGGSFATQVARNGASLALGRCPEPRSRWWFVGLGASVTHSSTLVVDNPRPGSAVVNIDVFGPRGAVAAPGLHGVTIPGRSTRRYQLNQVAPALGEVAASVIATRGLVSVAAPETYSAGGVGKPMREWVPAQPVPGTTLHLVGLHPKPDTASLLVANPTDVDAIVKVQLVGEKGPFTPQKGGSVIVSPRSVKRVPLAAAFDGKPVAVRLTSRTRIVASVRELTNGDESYAAAVGALRGVSVLGVPAGKRRELVLTAVRKDAVIELVSYRADGAVTRRQTVKVDAQTTIAVPFGPEVRFARVSTHEPVAVAGLLVVGAPGIGTSAVPPAARALRLPVIRPHW